MNGRAKIGLTPGFPESIVIRVRVVAVVARLAPRHDEVDSSVKLYSSLNR